MASKLVDRRTHEAENSLEISLREAFISLEPNLRPPFPRTIPTQKEYENLNRAILYGILCESHLAKVHIKHLHGKSTDGYEYFTGLLIKIVNEMFSKLVDLVRKQLLWVTREMVNVAAVGFDGLLVALLRQIVGGDFGEENLWLCFEMICLLSSKWDCLLKEEPFVLTGALYVFLRLLADHCRVSNVPKIEALRRMEIDFCVKILRQEFHLCLKIGRDLVRLLQDLVFVPDFRDIWKDLLYNPSAFKVDGFVDISQTYSARTASKYFLLRITPEMESQLRFLLTNVKIGSHKRHQIWFMEKFLAVPERKTVVTDILRFICCAHHPCNDIIRSDIIPKWAVIGWLLKCGLKNYVEANVKLALFYDWLFFDEKVDNITSLEPAILLMVHSLPNYIDVTHSLLEFLFILLDNYDLERKEIILCGISTAFDVIVRKGVVQSLDVLTSCDRLSPFLKQRLRKVLSDSQSSEVSASEQRNLIKQLREKTSAPIKVVKSALVTCNWDIEAAQKDLRKRGVVLASKKSARNAAEGFLALAPDKRKAVVVELNCETDFVARNEIFQYLALSLAKSALLLEGSNQSSVATPVESCYLEDLKLNMDHPKLSGERTAQSAVTEVATMMGENVKLGGGYTISSPLHGVISTYLHTSPQPGIGRIAGILSLEVEDKNAPLSAVEHVGSELAMHVVAAKPLFLTKEDVSSDALENEREVLRSQAECTGKSQMAIDKMVEGRLRKYFEEVVLLEQKFIVNDTVNIKTLLNNLSKEVGSTVKIGNFLRLEVGELQRLHTSKGTTPLAQAA